MTLNCPNCGEESEISQEYIMLTANEVKALYRIIENEWISRDDDEAMAVADKIGKFVHDLEKRRTNHHDIHG